MKLLYLTNVQIPAENAQNLQVQSMCKAFFYLLKDNFLLVSPWNRENEKMRSIYSWKKIKILRWPLRRASRQLNFIFKTKKIVKNFQPDVIYTRDIAVAWFFRKLGFKTVYEIHKPFTTMIGNMIFKLVSKNIKIVAISQALKNFIIKKYGLSSENVLVAHDGVFLEDYEKIKETKEELKKKYLNSLKDNFVVLYGGSFERGKGIDLILEASRRLPETFFVVIGGSQEEIKRMEDVPENLIFLGRKLQEEIPNYLKSADLLILPFTKNLSTYKYHSPLKIFEYMASGIPILASNLGSTIEILNDQNSFLFDPENLISFIEKIKYIKNNEEEAIIRTQVAMEDVKNYTWQKRAMNILNFLQ